VRTTSRTQVVFLDTPGLHRPRTPLGERTNTRALGTLDGVDVICHLVDATAPIGSGDRFVAAHVHAVGTPAILVVNKIDLASRDEVARQLVAATGLGDYATFVPVSSTTGDGTDALLAELESRLPEGPRYYPEGTVTDQSTAMLAAELLREQLLGHVRDELPHSIAVSVDALDDDPGDQDEQDDEGVARDELLRLRAVIRVERESQKGIVIGRGGLVLRDAGTAARQELERLLGVRVYLQTLVRVDRDWQTTPDALNRLGL